jgi:hypothetical protein
MVQSNIKVMKETMKERRSSETQANTNERLEKNNFPRVEIGNSVLTRCPPLSRTLLLDQALIGQLLQLLLFGAQSKLAVHRGPHGDELLVFDHLKSLLLVHFDGLSLAACYLLAYTPRALSQARCARDGRRWIGSDGGGGGFSEDGTRVCKPRNQKAKA